eukprot:gene15517-18388_t
MDLASAERVNAAGIALRNSTGAKCLDAAEVARCFRGLTAAEVNQLLPPSYLIEPTFPSAPGGMNYSPLVIVDGSTVVKPLLEALRDPVVDIPVIIQSLEQEFDLLPDANAAVMSESAYIECAPTKRTLWPTFLVSRICRNLRALAAAVRVSL